VRITHGTKGGALSSGRVELIIWVMAFTTFAYVSLSLSLSPLLTAIAQEFGVSESAVGQLVTVSGFVSTLSALIAAPWMGRYARRTWLRAELGLLMAAVMISALAPSFPVMVLGRILIGIAAGALVANCFTAASEVVTELGKQGRAVGIVASGTTVAVLAGLPAIAFLEHHLGWRWALGCLLVPLGLSLAGTGLLPTGKRVRAGDRHDEAIDRGLARRILREDRITFAIVLATGAIFVAYIGWITYYSAYVEHDVAGGSGRIGMLFIVGGLAELAGNFGAPALSHRAPVRRVALLGMAGMAVALLGSGVLFRSMGGLFAGIALLHLCTSFAYVGLNTLLVHRPARIRGTVMALSSAAAGLGGALGALIGGAVLAVTDDYLSVFHVLGALLGVGTLGLALAFRSVGNAHLVDNGAPLWSE
jgi:predicted MFS family arabinose efflux permease